jgi:hypothetical protein
MSSLHFVEVAAVAFSITESQTGTSETFTVTCGGLQHNHNKVPGYDEQT